MNLFDLVATLSLDSSKYEQGLGDAEENAKSFGGRLSGFLKGGVAVFAGLTTAVAGLSTAFVAGAKTTANYGDEVDKMSQKLGLSTEAYQKWDYVLNLAGTDIQSMTTGLKTLTNKIDDARNGSSSAQEMFAKLGISMEDLSNMSREEVFEATIKGFQGMADSTERAALANDLYGRSGQNLTPLFNQTAEQTQEQIELAEKYGMVMSEDAVKASAAFNDSLTTMNMTIKGLKNRMMGDFLPSLTEVTDGLAKVFTGDMSGADQIVAGIDSLMQDIGEKIPKITELGGKIISGFATAIVKGAPLLFQEGTKLLTNLAGEFIKGLPELVKVGANIITSVVDGIVDSIPTLIEAIPDIIVSLTLAVAENLPKIIESGGKILIAIVDGIIQAVPQLIRQAPAIIASFAQAIINAKETIIASGRELVNHLISGISNMWGTLKSKLAEFVRGIPQTIKNGLVGIASIGRDIVTGLWNGISDKIQWLKNMISGWIGNVKSFLKSLFGISSPSKWARDIIGGNIVKGLAQGLESGEAVIQNAFDSLLPDYNGDYALNVERPSAGANGVQIINYITVDGAENPEDFAERFVRQLRLDMRTV